MKNFLRHKKVKAAIIGLILNTIVGVLAVVFKQEIPPDVQSSILQIVAWSYPIITGMLVGGQAYADGRSGGATSSTPPPVERWNALEEMEGEVKSLRKFVEKIDINITEYSLAASDEIDECESTDTVTKDESIGNDKPKGKIKGNRDKLPQ